MADTIGTVRVELIADPSGIQRGIEQASAALTRIAVVGSFVGNVLANAFLAVTQRAMEAGQELLSGQGEIWDKLSANAQNAVTLIHNSLNGLSDASTSLWAQLAEKAAPALAIVAERLTGMRDAGQLARVGIDIFAAGVRFVAQIVNEAITVVSQLATAFVTLGQVAQRVGQAFGEAWRAALGGDFGGIGRAFGQAMTDAGQILQQGWDRMKEIGADGLRASQEISDGVAISFERAGQRIQVANKALEDYMKKLEAEALRVFEATRTPAERAQYEIDKLSQLFRHGLIDAETYARGIDLIKDKYSGMRDVLKQVGTSIANTFTDAILSGKKFGDVLKSLFNDIARIALNKVFTDILLGSNVKQGGIGGLLGGLSGLLGFASGGSFEVGGAGGIDSQVAAFRVTPGERVTVTKPGQGIGGGSSTINMRINLEGANGDEAIARISAQAARVAAIQAVQASNRSLPAWQRSQRMLET